MLLGLAELAVMAIFVFLQEPGATEVSRTTNEPLTLRMSSRVADQYLRSPLWRPSTETTTNDNEEFAEESVTKNAGSLLEKSQRPSPSSITRQVLREIPTLKHSSSTELISAYQNNPTPMVYQPYHGEPTPSEASAMTHSLSRPLSSEPKMARNEETFVFGPSSVIDKLTAPVAVGSSTILAFLNRPGTLPPNTQDDSCKPCEDHETCFKKECQLLLKQGLCKPGEWLIEKNSHGECVPSKCQYPLLPFQGQCLGETDLQEKLCVPGKQIVLARDGSFECDCMPRHIYNPQDNNCYPAYSQGPCERSQYFVLTPGLRNSSKAECLKNPCKQDHVCYGARCPVTGKCVKLNSVCKRRSGDTGVFSVNETTLTLDCLGDTPPRGIGNVPTFPCGKGSKRDITGRCRKVQTTEFS